MYADIKAGKRPIACIASGDGVRLRVTFAGVPLLDLARFELTTKPHLN